MTHMSLIHYVSLVHCVLSGAAGAGAVDEETFVRSFEDVGKVYVNICYFLKFQLGSFLQSIYMVV